VDGDAHPAISGKVGAHVFDGEASGRQVKVCAHQERHVQAPVDEEWVTARMAKRREQPRFFQKGARGSLRMAVLDSHLGPDLQCELQGLEQPGPGEPPVGNDDQPG
jgi:hypothetical protein